MSARDVRQLEDAELAAIYENDYWLPPRCHVLQQQLGLVHFDTAVNMGVGRAVKLLQAGLGCAVDGAFGPGTQKAADSCDLGTAVPATARRARTSTAGSPRSGPSSPCSSRAG